MYQIAFLIPYFGELPPFFEIWKKTAQRNEDVDFIFFSDNKRLSSEKNYYGSLHDLFGIQRAGSV